MCRGGSGVARGGRGAGRHASGAEPSRPHCFGASRLRGAAGGDSHPRSPVVRLRLKPSFRPVSRTALSRSGARAELWQPRRAWHLADAPGRQGPPSQAPRAGPLRPSSGLRAAASAPARAARPPGPPAQPAASPPAAPCAGPAAEPGPPARPVRDGAPGRLSRRSARSPRRGRSWCRAAALGWRCPAAAIPVATGLGAVPRRTPWLTAPLRRSGLCSPPGSRSASCASASVSSTRSRAPRGTTWAPCASCSR